MSSGERERALQRQIMAAEMRLEEAQEAQVCVVCVQQCINVLTVGCSCVSAIHRLCLKFKCVSLCRSSAGRWHCVRAGATHKADSGATEHR